MFPYQQWSRDIQEVKFIYKNCSPSSLDYNGQIFPLNSISIGYDSVNARLGSKIAQTCLHIRGEIHLKKSEDQPYVGGDFSPSQCTRLTVVEDLQPGNGGVHPTFTLSDLFEEPPALNSIVSDFNFSNLMRFRIWFDKCYVFDAFSHQTGALEGFVNRSVYWIDETIDLRGVATIYGPNVGRGGTIPTIRTSAFSLVTISNTNPPPLGGTQNGIDGNLRSTICFLDD